MVVRSVRGSKLFFFSVLLSLDRLGRAQTGVINCNNFILPASVGAFDSHYVFISVF